MNKTVLIPNAFGVRLLISLCVVFATYTLIDIGIRVSGIIVENIQNQGYHASAPMISVGCLAAIEMCNEGARSDGRMQSLFTDIYAGECTQCNPEISFGAYLAEIFILIAPGIFVFYRLWKKNSRIEIKPSARILFFGILFACIAYVFLNTFHVFFGP